ncbi:putative HMG1/2-like protein [Cocos nucifera]|nr:putative HMG1/2-like protein [Cocos nucifera]
MIDREMSARKNDGCNRPGIVARLMGMDTLPSEIKPMSYAKDRKDEKPTPRKETNEIVPTHKTSLISAPFKQTKPEIHPSDIEQDFTRSTKSLNLRKPQSREHPQEEELQKFKREFEAWQSSRIWKHSRTLELGNDLEQGNMQVLAQGNLNREKIASFMDSKRKLSFKEITKPKEYGSTAKLKKDMLHGAVPTNEGVMTKRSQATLRNDIASRNSAKTSHAHIPLANFENKMDRSSSPAKIVILKPCSERSDDGEESLASSPEIIEKENNMQDFLEEVRKRLNFEIRGKSRHDKRARWTNVDTYPREILIDPKQIARDIAKQIRETVANDFRTTLVWSDSTGSYRSKAEFNEPSSSAFLKRDPRKLSSYRQKNVKTPLTANGRLGTSVSRKEAMRLRPTYDLSKKDKKEICWEDKKALTVTKTRCFRHEDEKSVAFDYEAVSPRCLVRSHSVPVSGTAFRKHLLEDQHLSSGAHNRRKHEAFVPTSEEGRSNKKNGFNFKGRVSNFRGKFFGKKIHSMDEMAEDDIPYMKRVVTAPSVVLNIGIARASVMLNNSII